MINSKRIIDAIDEEIELAFSYMSIKKKTKELSLHIQALNRLRAFICKESEYERSACRNILDKTNYKVGEENY